MENIPHLIDDFQVWFQSFETTLEKWEGWLGQVEQAYVTGRFETLQDLEAESEPVQTDLAATRAMRAELIDRAHSIGFSGSSLTSLLRWLGQAAPGEWTLRLARVNQQLRRVQQMSTALWVTGFQAANYTSALLDILATGNADRATYGTIERTAHEGGQIVDAAA